MREREKRRMKLKLKLRNERRRETTVSSSPHHRIHRIVSNLILYRGTALVERETHLVAAQRSHRLRSLINALRIAPPLVP